MQNQVNSLNIKRHDLLEFLVAVVSRFREKLFPDIFFCIFITNMHCHWNIGKLYLT